MSVEIQEKLERLDGLRRRAGSIAASLSRGGSKDASDVAQDISRLTDRVAIMLIDLEKRLGDPGRGDEHELLLANLEPMVNGLQSVLDSLENLVDKNVLKRRGTKASS